MGKHVSTYEKQYQDGNYAAHREYLKQTKASCEVEPLVRKIFFNPKELQQVLVGLAQDHKDLLDNQHSARRYERFLYDPSSLIFKMKKLEKDYTPEQIEKFLKTLNGVKIFTINDLKKSPQFLRWKNWDMEVALKVRDKNEEAFLFLKFMKQFVATLKFDQ